VKIKLYYRHFGIHKLKKEIEISANFNDIAEILPKESENNASNNYRINEDMLIELLPQGFLPKQSKNILLSVDNGDDTSSGQQGLKHFTNWAKYFDAYCLEIGR